MMSMDDFTTLYINCCTDVTHAVPSSYGAEGGQHRHIVGVFYRLFHIQNPGGNRGASTSWANSISQTYTMSCKRM